VFAEVPPKRRALLAGTAVAAVICAAGLLLTLSSSPPPRRRPRAELADLILTVMAARGATPDCPAAPARAPLRGVAALQEQRVRRMVGMAPRVASMAVVVAVVVDSASRFPAMCWRRPSVEMAAMAPCRVTVTVAVAAGRAAMVRASRRHRR
jgi:hypothetical protein